MTRSLVVRLLLVWLALSVIALATNASMIVYFSVGGDDALRMLQVRDLLAGQGWYDVTQYRISPPEGVPMHWSRLVDAPLALGMVLLRPFSGPDLAERLVMVAMPLINLAMILLCVGFVAARCFGARVAMFAAIAVGLLSPVLYQLQPLRIDHHGWQIVSVGVALVSLVIRRDRVAGMLGGGAMGFGMTISLEILPMAAGFGAVFTMRWLTDCQFRSLLTSYLQALAASLAAFFLVAVGPQNLTLWCDQVGIAHIALFATVAVGATAVARVNPASALLVLAGLGASGIAAIGVFGFISPGCIGTPFGTLDPVVRDFWLLNVGEGRPIWERDPALAIPEVMQLFLALAATTLLWHRAEGHDRRFWSEYLLLLGLACVAGFIVWRSMAFAGIIAAVPLGWFVAKALQRIENFERSVTKLASLAVLALVLVPAIAVGLVEPFSATANERTSTPQVEKSAPEPVGVIESQCQKPGAMEALARQPKGQVFTHFDIGTIVLLNTPHDVVATGHHRAEKAMRDVIDGFRGNDDEARAILRRRGANYVAICADVYEMASYRAVAPDSFAAHLVEGQPPAWLEPITGDTSSFRAWRVR